MGSAVSAVTGGIGSIVGGAVGGVASSMTPQIHVADQGKLNDQIAALQSQQGNYNNNYNNAVGQVQGANGTAQNALNILQSQANGTAPSAAQGVLQHGTDQAIATQQAMANSGNLSQMLGGQKTAMDNAANLTQQSANQASQLRANQQAIGQEQYANAANANLGTNVNNAIGQGSLATGAATNAGNLAAGGIGLAQGVQTQNAQNQVQATGGLLNAGGAALGMMSDEDTKTNIQHDRAKGISDFFKNDKGSQDKPAKKSDDDAPKGASSYADDDPRKAFAKGISDSFSSDEDMKKDVKKDSMLHAFLDKINPVTYEYKDPTGEMGKTPGTHMGIIAQDVEKAPGGKSMVIETPQGKAIDMASAMGMLMSAAADSHERVSALEELFKSKMKKGSK